MGTRSRLALAGLAVLLAVLVMAVPAQAAGVQKGSTHITVGAAYVTELGAKHVTLAAFAPATQKALWNKSGNMYWWFRVPMKSGGTYAPKSGKGTFMHRGSIRFVEASETGHKIFRAEGIRILALSKTKYQMSVAYKTLAGPYLRVALAESTHAPKITHKGKAYKIDGLQFKLTQAGHDAILSVIGESLDMTKVIFSTDLLPILY